MRWTELETDPGPDHRREGRRSETDRNPDLLQPNTDGRERKPRGREDPPLGRGRDTTPTVGPEMTDQNPENLDRGPEGKHLPVVKDQIRETKLNQKTGEIFVKSTAG